MKQCRKCKQVKSADEFHKTDKHEDGLTSYCKVCNIENSQISKALNGNKPWMVDGFISEEDHFNYALERYAEIFNMPRLLEYRTKTGPYKRIYRDK